MSIQRLPDAELVIMKIIWKLDGEVTSAQIIEALDGEKDWAIPTVLNFLSRLTNRGFLAVRRSGKKNIYAPLIDENAYVESESKSFLQRLHGNSLTSLVASLVNGNAISEEDFKKLERYIEEKAGDLK